MSARADRNPHTAWGFLGREICYTGPLNHDPQAVRARLNGCDLAGNHDRSGAFIDHRRRNRLGAPLADAKTERRRGEQNAGRRTPARRQPPAAAATPAARIAGPIHAAGSRDDAK
jgi:hypothetical protein